MNKFTVSLIPFTFFENWSKEWIISDWKKKIGTMRSKCTEEDTVYMSRRRSNVVNPQVRNSKSAYFSQFDFPYSESASALWQEWRRANPWAGGSAPAGSVPIRRSRCFCCRTSERSRPRRGYSNPRPVHHGGRV